ncbi:MAG: hypothetical protein R3C97_07500 [Geminicoccaceae bacterium]
MQKGRGALQRVIEQLLDGLAEQDIGLVVLRDFSAFETACARFRTRQSFPAVRSPARRRASEFWLRLESPTGQGLATVAANIVETDDLFEDVRTGRLWFEDGFAGYCGLESITCIPPSRLLSGRLSVVGVHFAEGVRMSDETVWNISRLSQALAFKHQDSDFTVMLPDSAIDSANLRMLQATFERSEPCIDGLMPFAENDVSLPLMHSGRNEFMSWALETIAAETHAEALSCPVDQVEPV